MKGLISENDLLDTLYETEEMICVRDYNIEVLNTQQLLDKYLKEGENELTKFAMSSKIMEKYSESIKEKFLDFAFECNYLALKMSGAILFVYNREKEVISANIGCQEMIFRESEIESFMKICALTTRMEFVPTDTSEDGYSVFEIIFDLSEKSVTLANLIESLKEHL